MPPRPAAGPFVIAAVVLALGLAAAGGTFGSGQSASQPPPTPRPGGAGPAAHDTVTQIILTHTSVNDLAWGHGLWAVLGGTRVGHLDPSDTRWRMTGPLRTLCDDSQIAYGAGAVWVASGGCLLPGRVTRINPGSFAARISGPAPGYARGVAIWNGRPWITVPSGGPAIVAVDPLSLRLRGQRLSLNGQLQNTNDSPRFVSLLAARRALWGVDADPLSGITSIESLGANRLDGTTLFAELPAVAVPLTLGGGRVWGAFGRDVVGLPDVRPGHHGGDVTEVAAPDTVLGMAYLDGQLWFATSEALYRLQAGDAAPQRFTRLSFRVTSMVAGDGYLWAGDAAGGVARIGPLPPRAHAPAVGVIAG